MTNKICLSILMIFLLICQSHAQTENLDKILGERISGPANVRDAINGKILFSLDDNIKVECTEAKDNWHKVGLDVLMNVTQSKNFKFQKGDTIFNSHGEKIGIVKSDIQPLLKNKYKDIETGFIAGYTNKVNIKPESIIENVLTEIIENKDHEVFINDLKRLIDSFQMKKSTPTSQPNENGEWYYYEDNLLDDISPRDRITLIMENKKLIGVVHSHTLNLKHTKTYELIRGHKFTPVSELKQEQIDRIVKERINWYNSID